MIAFPSMLVDAALEAGIKTPPDPDNFTDKDYPHFAAFCILQLARPMRTLSEHWGNAKVIASVPEEKVLDLSVMDYINLGLSYVFGG